MFVTEKNLQKYVNYQKKIEYDRPCKLKLQSKVWLQNLIIALLIAIFYQHEIIKQRMETCERKCANITSRFCLHQNRSYCTALWGAGAVRKFPAEWVSGWGGLYPLAGATSAPHPGGARWGHCHYTFKCGAWLLAHFLKSC